MQYNIPKPIKPNTHVKHPYSYLIQSIMMGLVLFCCSVLSMFTVSLFQPRVDSTAYTGSGTYASPYVVSSASDWNSIIRGKASAGTPSSPVYVKLNADINLTSYYSNTSYMNISLTGAMYIMGNNKTITVRTYSYPLFSAISANCTFQNVKFAHSNSSTGNPIISTNNGELEYCSVTAGGYTFNQSPFVGTNKGTIRGCLVSGNVTFSNSAKNRGAIAGDNYGKIYSSSYSGKMTLGGAGGSCVGGIAGTNSGTIDSCTVDGTFSTSSTSNITNNTAVGGIAGINSDMSGNAGIITSSVNKFTSMSYSSNSYSNYNAIYNTLQFVDIHVKYRIGSSGTLQTLTPRIMSAYGFYDSSFGLSEDGILKNRIVGKSYYYQCNFATTGTEIVTDVTYAAGTVSHGYLVWSDQDIELTYTPGSTANADDNVMIFTLNSSFSNKVIINLIKNQSLKDYEEFQYVTLSYGLKFTTNMSGTAGATSQYFTIWHNSDFTSYVGEAVFNGSTLTVSKGYDETAGNYKYTTSTFTLPTTAGVYDLVLLEPGSSTTYSATISAGAGGSVTQSTVTGIASGTSWSVSGRALTIGSTTITATPNGGYSFSSWTTPNGATSGTVSGNVSFTANFTSGGSTTTYYAYISAGTGGSVSTTQVSNIASGTSWYYSGRYLYIGGYTVTATPNSGYNFSYWNTPNGSSSGTITRDSSFKAYFESTASSTLSVSFNVSGGGSLNYSSITVQNGTTYALDPDNSLVFSGSSYYNVIATANSGYRFDGWSSSSGTVTTDMTITAYFTKVWTVNFVYVCFNHMSDCSGVSSMGTSSITVEDGSSINVMSGSYSLEVQIGSHTKYFDPPTGYYIYDWYPHDGTITADTEFQIVVKENTSSASIIDPDDAVVTSAGVANFGVLRNVAVRSTSTTTGNNYVLTSLGNSVFRSNGTSVSAFNATTLSALITNDRECYYDVEDGYVALKSSYTDWYFKDESAPSANSNGVYEISTVPQLDYMMHSGTAGATYKLMKDLDCKGAYFAGENKAYIFDGNGYTLYNIYVSSGTRNYRGLFGGSATVKNLTIQNVRGIISRTGGDSTVKSVLGIKNAEKLIVTKGAMYVNTLSASGNTTADTYTFIGAGGTYNEIVAENLYAEVTHNLNTSYQKTGLVGSSSILQNALGINLTSKTTSGTWNWTLNGTKKTSYIQDNGTWTMYNASGTGSTLNSFTSYTNFPDFDFVKVWQYRQGTAEIYHGVSALGLYFANPNAVYTVYNKVQYLGADISTINLRGRHTIANGDYMYLAQGESVQYTVSNAGVDGELMIVSGNGGNDVSMMSASSSVATITTTLVGYLKNSKTANGTSAVIKDKFTQNAVYFAVNKAGGTISGVRVTGATKHAQYTNYDVYKAVPNAEVTISYAHNTLPYSIDDSFMLYNIVRNSTTQSISNSLAYSSTGTAVTGTKTNTSITITFTASSSGTTPTASTSATECMVYSYIGYNMSLFTPVASTVGSITPQYDIYLNGTAVTNYTGLSSPYYILPNGTASTNIYVILNTVSATGYTFARWQKADVATGATPSESSYTTFTTSDRKVSLTANKDTYIRPVMTRSQATIIFVVENEGIDGMGRSSIYNNLIDIRQYGTLAICDASGNFTDSNYILSNNVDELNQVENTSNYVGDTIYFRVNYQTNIVPNVLPSGDGITLVTHNTTARYYLYKYVIPSTSNTINASFIQRKWSDSDLRASAYAGGDGTSTNPYQVATAAQFGKMMSDNVRNYYVITNNIDLSGYYCTPFRAAQISSAGNSIFTINNLNVVTDLYSLPAESTEELPGRLYIIDAKGCNLIFNNTNVLSTSNFGIAVLNEGENIGFNNLSLNKVCDVNKEGLDITVAPMEVLRGSGFATGDITSYLYRSIYGESYGNRLWAFGLAGTCENTLNVYSTVNINIDIGYDSSDIQWNTIIVAGIACDTNNTSIKNAYFAGSININEDLTADEMYIGAISVFTPSDASHVYYLDTSANQAFGDGGSVGTDVASKTKAQLQTASTFAGWDNFNNNWVMKTATDSYDSTFKQMNYGYPMLAMFAESTTANVKARLNGNEVSSVAGWDIPSTVSSYGGMANTVTISPTSDTARALLASATATGLTIGVNSASSGTFTLSGSTISASGVARQNGTLVIDASSITANGVIYIDFVTPQITFVGSDGNKIFNITGTGIANNAGTVLAGKALTLSYANIASTFPNASMYHIKLEYLDAVSGAVLQTYDDIFSTSANASANIGGAPSTDAVTKTSSASDGLSASSSVFTPTNVKSGTIAVTLYHSVRITYTAKAMVTSTYSFGTLKLYGTTLVSGTTYYAKYGTSVALNYTPAENVTYGITINGAVEIATGTATATSKNISLLSYASTSTSGKTEIVVSSVDNNKQITLVRTSGYYKTAPTIEIKLNGGTARNMTTSLTIDVVAGATYTLSAYVADTSTTKYRYVWNTTNNAKTGTATENNGTYTIPADLVANGGTLYLFPVQQFKVTINETFVDGDFTPGTTAKPKTMMSANSTLMGASSIDTGSTRDLSKTSYTNTTWIDYTASMTISADRSQEYDSDNSLMLSGLYSITTSTLNGTATGGDLTLATYTHTISSVETAYTYNITYTLNTVTVSAYVINMDLNRPATTEYEPKIKIGDTTITMAYTAGNAGNIPASASGLTAKAQGASKPSGKGYYVYSYAVVYGTAVTIIRGDSAVSGVYSRHVQSIVAESGTTWDAQSVSQNSEPYSLSGVAMTNSSIKFTYYPYVSITGQLGVDWVSILGSINGNNIGTVSMSAVKKAGGATMTPDSSTTSEAGVSNTYLISEDIIVTITIVVPQTYFFGATSTKGLTHNGWFAGNTLIGADGAFTVGGTSYTLSRTANGTTSYTFKLSATFTSSSFDGTYGEFTFTNRFEEKSYTNTVNVPSGTQMTVYEYSSSNTPSTSGKTITYSNVSAGTNTFVGGYFGKYRLVAETTNDTVNIAPIITRTPTNNNKFTVSSYTLSSYTVDFEHASTNSTAGEATFNVNATKLVELNLDNIQVVNISNASTMTNSSKAKITTSAVSATTTGVDGTYYLKNGKYYAVVDATLQLSATTDTKHHIMGYLVNNNYININETTNKTFGAVTVKSTSASGNTIELTISDASISTVVITPVFMENYGVVNMTSNNTSAISSNMLLHGAPIRYIRDYVGIANPKWLNIGAYTYSGENVALGSTVTGSGTLTGGANAVDGSTSTTATMSSAGYITIDLGALHYIEYVSVCHATSGSIATTYTMVSADGNTWYYIYNSAESGEYTETADGYKMYVASSFATYQYALNNLVANTTYSASANNHISTTSATNSYTTGKFGVPVIESTGLTLFTQSANKSNTVKVYFTNTSDIYISSATATWSNVYHGFTFNVPSSAKYAYFAISGASSAPSKLRLSITDGTSTSAIMSINMGQSTINAWHASNLSFNTWSANTSNKVMFVSNSNNTLSSSYMQEKILPHASSSMTNGNTIATITANFSNLYSATEPSVNTQWITSTKVGTQGVTVTRVFTTSATDTTTTVNSATGYYKGDIYLSIVVTLIDGLDLQNVVIEGKTMTFTQNGNVYATTPTTLSSLDADGDNIVENIVVNAHEAGYTVTVKRATGGTIGFSHNGVNTGFSAGHYTYAPLTVTQIASTDAVSSVTFVVGYFTTVTYTATPIDDATARYQVGMWSINIEGKTDSYGLSGFDTSMTVDISTHAPATQIKCGGTVIVEHAFEAINHLALTLKYREYDTTTSQMVEKVATTDGELAGGYYTYVDADGNTVALVAMSHKGDVPTTEKNITLKAKFVKSGTIYPYTFYEWRDEAGAKISSGTKYTLSYNSTNNEYTMVIASASSISLSTLDSFQFVVTRQREYIVNEYDTQAESSAITNTDGTIYIGTSDTPTYLTTDSSFITVEDGTTIYVAGKSASITGSSKSTDKFTKMMFGATASTLNQTIYSSTRAENEKIYSFVASSATSGYYGISFSRAYLINTALQSGSSNTSADCGTGCTAGDTCDGDVVWTDSTLTRTYAEGANTNTITFTSDKGTIAVSSPWAYDDGTVIGNESANFAITTASGYKIGSVGSVQNSTFTAITTSTNGNITTFDVTVGTLTGDTTYTVRLNSDVNINVEVLLYSADGSSSAMPASAYNVKINGNVTSTITPTYGDTVTIELAFTNNNPNNYRFDRITNKNGSVNATNCHTNNITNNGFGGISTSFTASYTHSGTYTVHAYNTVAIIDPTVNTTYFTDPANIADANKPGATVSYSTTAQSYTFGGKTRYDVGATINLVATVSDGYTGNGWSVNGTTYAGNTHSIVLSGSADCTPVFNVSEQTFASKFTFVITDQYGAVITPENTPQNVITGNINAVQTANQAFSITQGDSTTSVTIGYFGAISGLSTTPAGGYKLDKFAITSGNATFAGGSTTSSATGGNSVAYTTRGADIAISAYYMATNDLTISMVDYISGTDVSSIGNITVQLLDSTGSTVTSTLTETNGKYSNIPVNSWIRITMPHGTSVSTSQIGYEIYQAVLPGNITVGIGQTNSSVQKLLYNADSTSAVLQYRVTGGGDIVIKYRPIVNITYSIIGNGSINVSNTATFTYNVTQNDSITAPTIAGYTFDGFYSGSTRLSTSATYTVSGNQTKITANYVQNVTTAGTYATYWGGSDNSGLTLDGSADTGYRADTFIVTNGSNTAVNVAFGDKYASINNIADIHHISVVARFIQQYTVNLNITMHSANSSDFAASAGNIRLYRLDNATSTFVEIASGTSITQSVDKGSVIAVKLVENDGYKYYSNALNWIEDNGFYAKLPLISSSTLDGTIYPNITSGSYYGILVDDNVTNAFTYYTIISVSAEARVQNATTQLSAGLTLTQTNTVNLTVNATGEKSIPVTSVQKNVAITVSVANTNISGYSFIGFYINDTLITDNVTTAGSTASIDYTPVSDITVRAMYAPIDSIAVDSLVMYGYGVLYIGASADTTGNNVSYILDSSGNPYVYHSVAHTGISITSDGEFNYVAIRAMAKYATDIMSVSVTQNGTPLTLSATVSNTPADDDITVDKTYLFTISSSNSIAISVIFKSETWSDVDVRTAITADSNKVYHVTTAEQLGYLAYRSAVADNINFLGYTISIENDIDLSGKYFIPFYSINGIIRGNYHTISNVHNFVGWNQRLYFDKDTTNATDEYMTRSFGGYFIYVLSNSSVFDLYLNGLIECIDDSYGAAEESDR